MCRHIPHLLQQMANSKLKTSLHFFTTMSSLSLAEDDVATLESEYDE